MEVYKSRMPSLRSVAEVGGMRGDDQTFLVYGDRTYGFTEFIHTANGVARALRDRFGLQQGDRVAVLSQNNPEWCLTFWATVQQGAVLVGLNGWWTTDEIQYGLQDSGAKVLVADQKRFERIAGSLDPAPDLEHVFLIDCTPGRCRARRRQAGAPLRRAHRLPHRGLLRRRHRRGRPRRHLLHVGHDRTAEGRHLDPPQHDRQPPEHDVRRRRRRHGRRRGAARRGRRRTSRSSPPRSSTCRAATPPSWSGCSPA